MNHDPATYGQDPDVFRPERFLNEDGTHKEPPPDTKDEGHYSFGFGRRICPGRHLASNIVLSFAIVLWAAKLEPGNDVHGNEAPINISNDQGTGFQSSLRSSERMLLAGGRKGSDWPGGTFLVVTIDTSDDNPIHAETDLDHIHHGISMLTAEVDEPPLHEKPSTPQFSELVDIHDERYYASCHHPTRHHHQHESPVIPPPFLYLAFEDNRSRFDYDTSIHISPIVSLPFSLGFNAVTPSITDRDEFQHFVSATPKSSLLIASAFSRLPKEHTVGIFFLLVLYAEFGSHPVKACFY
uniref:Cytochrome p450 n=1 Tax=Moniliophthora roreri TaxID=221103 RepID=A0A0W0F733_MONRR